MVDASTVREPGKTGSLWRLHDPIRVPSLPRDHFRLTETEGEGPGESFTRFPVAAGDHPVGDRGHPTAKGIARVVDAGGYVPVRVNTGSLPFKASDGRRPDPLQDVCALQRPGAVAARPVLTEPKEAATAVTGRLCAARRSEASVAIAVKNPATMRPRKGRC